MKMEDPHSLKSNEMAQCSFQPQQPLVCDTFKNCEGLSRVAFMDGNGVVMLGNWSLAKRRKRVPLAARRSERMRRVLSGISHAVALVVCTACCAVSWHSVQQ